MNTEYKQSFNYGTPGMPWGGTGTAFPVIDTRAVEGDNMHFGIAVVVGSRPGKTVKVGEGTFEGISVNTWVIEKDYRGQGVTVHETDPISVMKIGRVWVALKEGATPKYGDPVHIVDDGLLSNQGGTLIQNARFITENIGSDCAAIELR